MSPEGRQEAVGATTAVLAVPAGGATTVAVAESVACGAEMEAMVDTQVAPVAVAAPVVRMAGVGWRSSPLGGG